MSCQTSRPFSAKAVIAVPGIPLVITRNNASSDPPLLKLPVAKLGPTTPPVASPPWQAAHWERNDRAPAASSSGVEKGRSGELPCWAYSTASAGKNNGTERRKFIGSS